VKKIKILLIAFSGQDVSLKTRLDSEVGDHILAATALDGHFRGLGSDARGGDDNTGDLD
jgi:hypothetical protein